MRIDRKMLIGIGLSICAGCLLGAGFFCLFEKKEVEVTQPPSYETRKNPYLALEQFIQHAGIEVESTTTREILEALPPTDNVMIFDTIDGIITEEKQENLIAWIENGGEIHFSTNIIHTEGTERSRNTFLNRFNIVLIQTGTTEDMFESIIDINTKEDVHIRFPDDRNPVIEFVKHRVLLDPDNNAEYTYEGENGIHLAIIHMQSGKIHIYSDTRFLTNDSIGRKDHAWYVSRVITGKKKAWIVRSSNMPSLTNLLADNVPWFLVMFVITLIFAIMRLSMRSGPVFSYTDSSTRNILEHLDAVGYFQWRSDKGNFMIAQLRRSIESRLKKKHPYFNSVEGKEKYKILSQMTHISEADLYNGFHKEIQHQSDFIETVSTLKKLYYGNL